MQRVLIALSLVFAALTLTAAPSAAQNLRACLDGSFPSGPMTADQATNLVRRAVESCNRIIASSNFNKRQRSQALARRGHWHSQLGLSQDQLKDLDEAVEMDPANAEALTARGELLVSRQRYEEGIADISRALEVAHGALKKDQLYSAYSTRARAYEISEKFDLAIADLTSALEVTSNRVRRGAALWDRAKLLTRSGDLRGAIADYSEALRAAPEQYYMYFQRAEIYRQLGQYQLAASDYDRAFSVDPSDLNILSGRAQNFLATGQFDKALADLNAALKAYPDSTHLFAERAKVYDASGDVTRALADYRVALREYPRDRKLIDAIARLESNSAPAAAIAKTQAPSQATSVLPDSPTFTAVPVTETRVALVIGNSAYSNAIRLANPKADAELIAASLERVGFSKVSLALNLTREKLIDALKTFAAQADKSDWAVIYFAGHGLEIGGVNYLIPTDAKLASDRDIPYETIALDQVLHAVGGARKLKLVLLDACRDNPFARSMTRSASATRSIGRGLAPVEDSGTLVAYAAKHGQIALDGDGVNSPFAIALARRIEMPGLDVQMMLRKVRDDVFNATGKQQEPFQYGSLPGEELYFRPMAAR